MRRLIIFLSCLAVWLSSCLMIPVKADDIDDEIEKIKKQISELQTQKGTLSSAISYLDSKIELATISISQSEKKIAALEKEISGLSDKIGILDKSLGSTSQLLLARIIETYKKGRIEPVYLFVTADGFSDFLTRYNYLKIVQAHDRNLMYQMEQTRLNYDSQKNLKEEKQAEMETIKANLEKQHSALSQEKENKKTLLTETKGKEAEYQRILARLEAEKTKLSGASLFGKPTEFKVWTEANNYFNQTDERWAMDLIGGGVFFNPNDPSYLWKYGCAVTSMAMVLKKQGVDVNPKTLSAQSIYVTDLIAWQDVPKLETIGGSIVVKGHSYGGSPDWQTIDNKLSEGKWVIVYVSDKAHYVVLLSKEGSDYKMHDPYFGNELSFNSKYSQSAVDEMVIYER